MKSYAWDAADYERSSSAQHKWAKELIAKLNLKGVEHLLDIGSGDGKVTAEIAEILNGGLAVGIDSSEEMITLARTRYSKNQFANLQFLQADARSLPFENTFDVVFSNATMHWILDHQPVLKGIAQSLRPGGCILLQMGGKGNGAGIISVLEEMMALSQWCDYFVDFTFPYGFYDAEDYQSWLADLGLKPVRVELIPKDMTHLGREGLEAWFRTTWIPYTQRVPDSERSSFTTQLIDRYLDCYPVDKDGLAHVQMVRLEVEAIKES